MTDNKIEMFQVGVNKDESWRIRRALETAMEVLKDADRIRTLVQLRDNIENAERNFDYAQEQIERPNA